MDLSNLLGLFTPRAGGSDYSVGPSSDDANAPWAQHMATRTAAAVSGAMNTLSPSPSGYLPANVSQPQINPSQPPAPADTSDYHAVINNLLSRYGLQGGTHQNLFLPEGGFFARHRGIAGALEGGVL